MIKWSEDRGGSVSFENDDIRRSLEMLDDILAEYEHDSDNNTCKSSENHTSYERYNSRSRPPPPPEEAARVIVSYFPRCQNGIGGDSSRGTDEHEPLNADSCNNNAAYIDYELARLTDEYNMYEEKQKMANKPRAGLRNLSSPPLPSSSSSCASPPLRGSSPRQMSSTRNAPPPPPPPKFLETRFPEFPEFQLRMTSHGRYQTSDDDLDESSSQSPDDTANTSVMDEDSESRSGSEECSSVIEMPLKSGPSVSPTGQQGQQERPEDYVAVHPKKYFEDYPASVDSLASQVYSPPDDRANPRHRTPTQTNKRRNNHQEILDDQEMLIQDDDAEEEEEEEEEDEEDEEDDMAVMDMTLPPPPAFETRDMDDDDQESDGDSPNLMDDTEYFYDITRSADDLSNDDEDEEDEQRMEEEEDEGTITETSPRERFSIVHQMYREGSLDGLDETPPNFKPPPPPSSHSPDGDFPTPSASEDEEEEEEEECDEAHVRWRVALPNRGRGLVFGTAILLMNRQVKTYPRPSSVASSIASSITTVSSTRSGSRGGRGISPKSSGVKTDDLMMDDQEFHLPSFSDVGSRSSLSSSSTLTHQRPLSAELLGIDRLPDVRSIVDSFNQKEVRAVSRSPPPCLDRKAKASKEFVSTLKKELPLFKNIKPVKPPTKPKTSEKPVKASTSGTWTTKTPKSPKTPTDETHTSILKASITQPLQATKTKIMGMCKSSTLSHFPKVVKSHLTSSRPSGAMTLPKRESSRAAKAMAMALSLPSRAKNTIKIVTRPHTPSMEPTLLQTTPMPSRVSSDDLPRLLSYRVVNNDSLPPTEISTATMTSRIPKGATLPRISHENRRPQLSTEFGGPFSPPANMDGTRRIPPPPPPLTKGPPPKIFVEVQPTRSESSCTSSCSCLCTKHQSPCQSPVPPPMPGAQQHITDANVPDLQEQHMVPYHNATAIASTSRNEDECPNSQQECGRGLHFSIAVGGQPKKGKKSNNPPAKKSSQNSEKSGSEQRNNALIMEIQAAIQHRKSSDPDAKASKGSEPGTSIPGNRKIQSKTLPNLSAEDNDKSPEKRGFFKGFLRRGNSGN
uniref:Uncharacterized protein n=1 Tax=Strigamia maritima TaxID=126957 RepID=T1IN75_STRMM